jgi:hypothetical protein
VNAPHPECPDAVERISILTKLIPNVGPRVTTVLLLICGPGRFSIDALIVSCRERCSA